MKKVMRHFGTALAAMALVFSLGTAARADEAQANNRLTIEKEIVVTNPDGESVYAPAITYTYEIAPAANGATVTDANNHSAVVKAGIAEAVETATVSIDFTSNEKAAASAEGTELAGSTQFTFDENAFPSAGIYRYQITENQPAGFAAAGLTRSDEYKAERILDVYVKNTEDGLEIYGFILFEGSENDDINTETVKSEGWVKDTGIKDVDVYRTTNLTVTKTIDGTLADKTHDFPFQVNVDSRTITNGRIIVDGQMAAFDGSYELGALAADSELKLGNNDSVQIIGIPVGADDTTYTVNEFNDTPDTYISKNAEEKTLAADNATDYTALALSSDAVTSAFTNTLDAVSPTGIVMRFAPYALMLGAGTVIFAISRRRETEEI